VWEEDNGVDGPQPRACIANGEYVGLDTKMADSTPPEAPIPTLPCIGNMCFPQPPSWLE
jgi:hypothetical protein